MCASYWIKRAEADWADMLAWLALGTDSLGWANHDFKKRGEQFLFPGYDVPAITRTSDQRTLNEFRWGFLPPWASSAVHKPAPFNARSETARTSGMFKQAFRRQRCLMPAHGFYEWREEDGKKRRYLVAAADGRPFALAGLWSDWQGTIRTCTILTTTPNRDVEPFHDRMPVILDEPGMTAWLDPRTDDERLQSLCRPAERELTATPGAL